MHQQVSQKLIIIPNHEVHSANFASVDLSQQARCCCSRVHLFFCPAMAAVSDLVCAQWMVANNHNKEKRGMLLVCVI